MWLIWHPVSKNLFDEDTWRTPTKFEMEFNGEVVSCKKRKFHINFT